MALNRIRQVVSERIGESPASPGLADLARRVEELEGEVQEGRELNLRIAELTDVVVELLVPLADSGDPRVAAIIDRYRRGVTSAADTDRDDGAETDGP